MTNANARIMLSGSRGIGGAFTTLQGVTTLELLDLEEDDEEDEDEELDEEELEDQPIDDDEGDDSL